MADSPTENRAEVLRPAEGRVSLADAVAARVSAAIGPVCSHPPPARRPVSERIAECRKHWSVIACKGCGKAYRLLARCHSRLCRPCARARGTKWGHRLAAADFRHPVMLTLSTLPGPDAAASYALIRRAWRVILRRRYNPERGVRVWRCGVAAVECKPNPAGWYVHLHALVDCVSWTDMARLQAEWQELTGAYVADIRRVDRHRVRGAIAEVVKYVTDGFGKFPLSPAQLDELDTALRGKRLTETWGRAALFNALLDTIVTSLHRLLCPDCGCGLRYVGRATQAGLEAVPVFDFSAGARAGPPCQPAVAVTQ